MMAIITQFTFQKLIIFISKSQPEISEVTEIMGITPDDKLNVESNFKIAFGFIDHGIKHINSKAKIKDTPMDPNLVELEVSLRKRDQEGFIISDTPLKYHKCTQHDYETQFKHAWGPQRNQIKEITNREMLYCLDKNQPWNQIYGDVNGGKASFI
jgi:hypothetical protein